MSLDPLFDAAIQATLLHEGGLHEEPGDPGGLTNFGISLRQYPKLGEAGIRALTAAAAAAIYRSDFWLKFRWNELDDFVSPKVLDIGVDIGPSNIALCLQRALRANGQRVAEDGNIGDRTIAACKRCFLAPRGLLAALKSECAGHYRMVAQRNPEQSGDLDGWLNRAYG